MYPQPRNGVSHGFTLLEILLAMFIFTIVSMIIVSALHSVFTTQSAVEKRAKRLAELQIAFLYISRDFEQAINRPINLPNGGLESAFLGSPDSVTFTHSGVINPQGIKQRSSLQRVHYFVSGNQLIRESWPQLDRTPESSVERKVLLTDVSSLAFKYLDAKNNFFSRWPSPGEMGNMGSLPKAVKILVTLPDLGKISQLYIIPGQTVEKIT